MGLLFSQAMKRIAQISLAVVCLLAVYASPALGAPTVTPTKGVFVSRSAPFVAFRYPEFRGWTTKVSKDGVIFEPGETILADFDEAPGIRVGETIKRKISAKAAKNWKASAKVNSYGVHYKYDKKRGVYDVRADHLSFLIQVDLLQKYGYDAKKVRALLESTLQVHTTDNRMAPSFARECILANAISQGRVYSADWQKLTVSSKGGNWIVKLLRKPAMRPAYYQFTIAKSDLAVTLVPLR